MLLTRQAYGVLALEPWKWRPAVDDSAVKRASSHQTPEKQTFGPAQPSGTRHHAGLGAFALFAIRIDSPHMQPRMQRPATRAHTSTKAWLRDPVSSCARSSPARGECPCVKLNQRQKQLKHREKQLVNKRDKSSSFEEISRRQLHTRSAAIHLEPNEIDTKSS